MYNYLEVVKKELSGAQLGPEWKGTERRVFSVHKRCCDMQLWVHIWSCDNRGHGATVCLCRVCHNLFICVCLCVLMHMMFLYVSLQVCVCVYLWQQQPAVQQRNPCTSGCVLWPGVQSIYAVQRGGWWREWEKEKIEEELDRIKDKGWWQKAQRRGMMMGLSLIKWEKMKDLQRRT